MEIHQCSEVAVKSWLFQGTPRALHPQKNESLHHFGKLKESKLNCSYSLLIIAMVTRFTGSQQGQSEPCTCLTAHIQVMDKADVVARDKKGLEVYQPYIEDMQMQHVMTSCPYILRPMMQESWRQARLQLQHNTTLHEHSSLTVKKA
jgi:hypothetical protein